MIYKYFYGWSSTLKNTVTYERMTDEMNTIITRFSTLDILDREAFKQLSKVVLNFTASSDSVSHAKQHKNHKIIIPILEKYIQESNETLNIMTHNAIQKHKLMSGIKKLMQVHRVKASELFLI